MRNFFLLQSVNPDTGVSRGFVRREGSGSKTYRLTQADHATLYTTKSGAMNSMKYALYGLRIEIPADLSYYSRRRFIREHFKVVEVQALLLPRDGFLDKVLG